MHVSTCIHPIRPAPFVGNSFFFPLCGFNCFFFYQKSGAYRYVDLHLGLSVLSVFIPVASGFIIIALEIRGLVISPDTLLLYRIILAILRFLFVHIKLNIVLKDLY